MRVLFNAILLIAMLLPLKAFSFDCNMGWVAVPVDVSLNKDSTEINLTDMRMSNYECKGDIGYQYKDALRITSAILNSTLMDAGFTGFVIDPSGVKHDFGTAMNVCVWIDANCRWNANAQNQNVSSRLPLVIGIKSNGNNKSVRLSSGTNIVNLSVQQRGLGGVWVSNYYSLRLALKSDLIIPSYTCDVDNGDVIKVTLPPVDINAMRNKNGRHDGVVKEFDLNLKCEPKTSVNVKFDGDIMAGHPDVLKNTVDRTQSVGIQVVRNGETVVFGENKHVIDSAQLHETLSYKAYYYYNGGELNPGPVKTLSTATFDYR